MLRDLGHPAADGEPLYDVTYENVQAGERTSHLFRLANYHDALVLGTGDLSELALGWCTYGVGDQMSHYNVNASVPKTLIQFLVRWAVDTDQFGPRPARCSHSVLDTGDLPRAGPGRRAPTPTARGRTARRSSAPTSCRTSSSTTSLRFGYRPSKVAFLAHHAWGDRDRGELAGPDPGGAAQRVLARRDQAAGCEVFLHRFFQTSQFKRSAMPNGPKVGSGGSLSPRGDWRAPSDGHATRLAATSSGGRFPPALATSRGRVAPPSGAGLSPTSGELSMRDGRLGQHRAQGAAHGRVELRPGAPFGVPATAWSRLRLVRYGWAERIEW